MLWTYLDKIVFCLLYCRPLSGLQSIMLSYLFQQPLGRAFTFAGHFLDIPDVAGWISIHGALNFGAKVLHIFDTTKSFRKMSGKKMTFGVYRAPGCAPARAATMQFVRVMARALRPHKTRVHHCTRAKNVFRPKFLPIRQINTQVGISFCLLWVCDNSTFFLDDLRAVPQIGF